MISSLSVLYDFFLNKSIHFWLFLHFTQMQKRLMYLLHKKDALRILNAQNTLRNSIRSC